jgi:hypothetical protein
VSVLIPALVGAFVVLVIVIELLRRRQLSEKYAVLWLLVGTAVLVMAAAPGVLEWLSKLVGVKTPSNLLFFVASLTLLVVCGHLSWETSRLEDETRTLAEEVALLRLQVEEAQRDRRP